MNHLTDVVIRELHVNSLSLYKSADGEYIYLPRRGIADAGQFYNPTRGFREELIHNNPPNPWFEQDKEFPTIEQATGYARALADVAYIAFSGYLDQVLSEELQAQWRPEIMQMQQHLRRNLASLRGSKHELIAARIAAMSIPQLTEWSNAHTCLVPFTGAPKREGARSGR